MAVGHKWDVDKMLRNFHVWDEGVDLDDPACQVRLIEAALDLKIVLAPFDPLIDLCGEGVEENSNSDAKRVTRFLRKFARATRATPVLSMHTAKAAEGRTREDRVRGASAWRNATRLCWWVEPCDSGIELDPIKANRSGRPKVIRVRQTITTEPDNDLMWTDISAGAT